MRSIRFLLGTLALAFFAALPAIDLAADQTATSRTFRPDDQFRIQRIGAIAWSPDGKFATVEFTRPGRWLDSVPANDIALVDVAARVMRPLSSKSPAFLGFFNAVWSGDGRRLAFLSVDVNARVRLWVWSVGASAPALVPAIEVKMGTAEPPIAWIDRDRLAVMGWEAGAQRSGLLYSRVLRGRNVADAWRQAIGGRAATVSVLESGRASVPIGPGAQLVALDLVKGTRRVLARGRIHRLGVSADGCCVTFLRENPGIPGQPVASYVERAERANDVDAGYNAVNWGTEPHAVDARSGVEVPLPPASPARRPSPTIDAAATRPRSDARLLSTAPSGAAALYAAHGSEGSRLWIAGGGGRPLAASREIWRANEWMRDVRLGRAESFAYTAADGTELAAWMLLPHDYVAGTRAPVVTIVYPGSVYGPNVPSSFSAFQANFEHPQLFAALGYVVLLPSMPAPPNPADSHALAPLLSGVLPAIDGAVARGIADPDRIAVVGQSDGGFAVLGLIAQTNRFRSAIASASFSNFVSLYGTLYGQYRHGDGGRPEAAQVLRILQLEKGVMGLGGPPWTHPERYHANSALLRAGNVETPLMLIHGDLDFIPIEQAEEFFTALFRQDKRAVLVRYAGEGHTIADRANVLDLWARLQSWLAETLASRHH